MEENTRGIGIYSWITQRSNTRVTSRIASLAIRVRLEDRTSSNPKDLLQEEEKRIAKEKEAAELEAKCKIQECLNIEEKSIPQASTRSRKFRIDPTLSNFTISTKRIPLSDFEIPPVTPNVETVNSLSMGDKHLDTSKDSLESSVKDPIPIPSESNDTSNGAWNSLLNDDKFQKALNDWCNLAQQNSMLSIYDENNKIRDCYKLSPSTITPDLSITVSLIMEDEHLNTIPKTESDEFIKSSVENLVPTPSESADLSDGKNKCDVPINDDSPESHFLIFDNPLFDSNDDFSSDDESLSEEEVPKEEFKFFSNPLYDLDDEIITNEKILSKKDLDIIIPIPPGMDEPCFNAESYLLETLLKQSNSEYFNATIESLSPSPISIEDSDPFMEEIDIFLASDDSTPPGIDSDDDSEGDILPLEELLDNVLFPLPESDDFTVYVEPVAAETNDFDVLNNNEPFDPGEVKCVFSKILKGRFLLFYHSDFSPFVIRPEFILYLALPGVKIRSLTPESLLKAGDPSSGWNFHVL
ncbi:hypothetical protein Tco_0790333 [Tanacetum coccineum]